MFFSEIFSYVSELTLIAELVGSSVIMIVFWLIFDHIDTVSMYRRK